MSSSHKYAVGDRFELQGSKSVVQIIALENFPNGEPSYGVTYVEGLLTGRVHRSVPEACFDSWWLPLSRTIAASPVLGAPYGRQQNSTYQLKIGDRVLRKSDQVRGVVEPCTSKPGRFSVRFTYLRGSRIEMTQEELDTEFELHPREQNGFGALPFDFMEGPPQVCSHDWKPSNSEPGKTQWCSQCGERM